MPLNLFALCGLQGDSTVKRVQVTQEVQEQLDVWFDITEARFREEIEDEVDFDGRWKPDPDELMRIPLTEEAQAAEPRPESQALIGRRLNPQAILGDLRTTKGVESALGLARPNSGLTLRIPR